MNTQIDTETKAMQVRVKKLEWLNITEFTQRWISYVCITPTRPKEAWKDFRRSAFTRPREATSRLSTHTAYKHGKTHMNTQIDTETKAM